MLGLVALLSPDLVFPSGWVGLVIGDITGLVIGRLWVLVRTLVRPISVMMQDFGDFARLGGFQNIKLYF